MYFQNSASYFHDSQSFEFTLGFYVGNISFYMIIFLYLLNSARHTVKILDSTLIIISD